MKLNFIGNITELLPGLQVLEADYNFSLSPDGLPVEVAEGGCLRVSRDGGKARIEYSRRSEFFRALGLLLEKAEDGEENFAIEEKAFFETCGGMADMSHGALLNLDALKSCFRKMAMMGLNMFFLYREESYHIPEYEYFGYMRGRHTDEQIKELDDYAYNLGIEIIPAIQCLGHLSNTLHWGQFAEIKDTYDCLLVGEEKTYEFIECMLRAAMRPLRTKRVHIGFDETMSLGTGAYRVKHGQVPREDIFCEHLNRVAEICKKLGLTPNIWADMFFRLGGAAVGYEITNHEIPKEVAEKIPENLELTAYTYSALSEDSNIKKHIQTIRNAGRKVWFGGCVHDWHGFCVNYYLTRATSELMLRMCKKLGVDSIIDTSWGDDSTERDYFCNLLGFQMYAEHMYREAPDFEEIKKRFSFCARVPAQMILDISDIDNAEGVGDLLRDKVQVADAMAAANVNGEVLDAAPSIINPSKYLFWQDPLSGLFDTEVRKVDFKAHFEAQKKKLESYRNVSPEYANTQRFYIALCDALLLKYDLGFRMREAYLAGDRETLRAIAEKEIPELHSRIETMWQIHRVLWFERHQAFGFDVVERRYGGLLMRLKTAAYRVTEYLDGKIDSIEELAEPRLPVTRPSKHVCYYNNYLGTSSAWGRA